jgi:acyl-CoA thioester hydrolase
VPALFDHHHIARDDEIDAQGHVNNLRYLHWAIDAAVAHSREQGWTHARYVELGIGWVVRQHTIKYLQSALAGDEIIVRTWVADMQRFSSTRKYKMLRAADGVVLATAETQWVLVDMQTRSLAKIPQVLIDSFELVSE